MKFNYKLKRLCGAYYGHPVAQKWSGSNLCYDSTGNLLISSVSNRIQILDLKSQTTKTLPVEARSNISCIALSPDDSLLMVVDVQNHAMLIHFARGIVLHRMAFKQRVRRVIFSPNNKYIAVTVGKQLQVWCSLMASAVREFAPLVLHRTYTGPSDQLTCVSWSADATVLVGGSRDGTLRVWTLQTTKDFQPVTLAGHKRPVVGAFFGSGDTCVHSVSEDGAMVTWEYKKTNKTIADNNAVNDDQDEEMADGDDAVNFFAGGDLSSCQNQRHASDLDLAHTLVGATWKVKVRHYFHQDRATVSSCHFCVSQQLLAVGFSTGVFGLYELPECSNIHTLSVGNGQFVKACVLNSMGEWLALGCPASQQLLVWEWRSETYVLKQRGHAYGMRCMAYSPDGIVVCTGGEDGRVKLWNATSGFCYVTLEKTHTAAVTGVVFANPSVVLSASLDGTVRAHDMHRYRTFRTLTTPTPVQFLNVAVDPSGEIVLAGSTDPFHIYSWNLQTGKLLDVFTGHAGPVSALAFQPNGGMLFSASWDGTVKVWDMYKDKVPMESLQHTSDVVCVSCRPDGKEICAGTIGGLLSFWNVEHSKLKFEIDGRRDIAGGRKMNDRMTADNNAASRYFTSVCYSADGSCVIAGGNSKYVCIYEVSQQILLKKFQVTFNRSLDGVLDELNSKNLVDGVPVDEEEDSADETTYNALALPGARRGDDGSRKSRVEVLTSQVAFASTGREWAAVSGEGLHVYSLDDDMIFDPISLTEDITPAAVEVKLASGEYTAALKMAIHLNEFGLVKQVLEDTPYDSIPHVVRSLRVALPNLARLMQFIATIASDSPHVEFYLQWCLEILQTHGMTMDRNRSIFMRSFRAMHKAIQTRHDELKSILNDNKYTLEFVDDHAKLVNAQREEEAAREATLQLSES
ncbi:hypothetical protein MPSEU_000027100 [Mayamaea pseudoterrestris]|nr:hypothetical protein MPSEU_000027100 [Mayamaea pseudoterrestris]